MKIKNHIINKIAIVLLFGFMFQSCLFHEEDIFDKPAYQRLTDAVQFNFDNFVSAPNGWEMRYFPTSDQQGFTLLMRFYENEFATLMGRNITTGNVDLVESGRFRMRPGEGAILSFDTENPVIHEFANPSRPPVGIGFGGDYEFVVIRATEDFVQLRGLRRHTNIEMRRMPAGKDWSQHFDELDAMRTFLLDRNVILQLNRGSQVIYSLQNSTSGVFDAAVIDSVVGQIPFVITTSGLSFERPFPIGIAENQIVQVQNFNLNEARNQLISAENQNFTIAAPPLGEFFRNGGTGNVVFLAEKQEISGMDALFDQLAADMIAAFNPNFELTNIGFGRHENNFVLALRVRNGTVGLFSIPLVVAGNNITIPAFDVDNMQFANNPAENNARLFYDRVASIRQLLSLIQGEYTLETSTPFNLHHMKFTKTDGSLMFNTSR